MSSYEEHETCAGKEILDVGDVENDCEDEETKNISDQESCCWEQCQHKELSEYGSESDSTSGKNTESEEGKQSEDFDECFESEETVQSMVSDSVSEKSVASESSDQRNDNIDKSVGSEESEQSNGAQAGYVTVSEDNSDVNSPERENQSRNNNSACTKTDSEEEETNDPSLVHSDERVAKNNAAAGNEENNNMQRITPRSEVTLKKETEKEYIDFKYKHFNVFFKDVNCGLCFFVFDEEREPKVLPCGHNVCSVCLKRRNMKIDLCPTCNADLSHCGKSQFYTNKRLVETINKVFKDKTRSNISVQSVANFQDTFCNPEDGATENDDNEKILNSIDKLEDEMVMRFKFLSYSSEMLREKAENLSKISQNLKTFLSDFMRVKAELMGKETSHEMWNKLAELSTNITDYNNIILKAKEPLEDGLEFQKRILHFWNEGIATNSAPTTEEIMAQDLCDVLTPHTQYYFYYDCPQCSTSRRYAELQVMPGRVDMRAFDVLSPNGGAVLINFSPILSGMLSRVHKLFMDIEHKIPSNGESPNRFYITPEFTQRAGDFIELFGGLSGATFLQGDVEDTGTFVEIKNYCRQSVPLNFFQGQDCLVSGLSHKIKPGTLVAALNDDCVFKIVKKVEGLKKTRFCILGQITSGVRELGKIGAHCFVKNCGLSFR